MRISIDNACKTFAAVRALDGVSIEIAAGEIFFLLGPSGCGKTTLLRALAGFLELDSGCVRFDGRDVTAVPPHERNTGMMFQGYALWPHMTVAQNVAFGLEQRRLPRADRELRTRRALERVRIADLAERKPHQLSGGQQQRVALARTLVIEPACLLLDEPLANLDAKLRLEMRSEIRRLCKESGLTAVYVTHDQKEALSVADRLAVMHQGRVLQSGTPRQLYQHPLNAFVAEFIGETNFVPGQVREVNDGAVSLDTAFGPFRSVSFAAGLARGQAVQLALRPEVFQISRDAAAGAAGNVLRVTVREAIYLGGMAQYIAELAPGLTLTVTELNPREPATPGAALLLRVAAEDVIVLAAAPST